MQNDVFVCNSKVAMKSQRPLDSMVDNPITVVIDNEFTEEAATKKRRAEIQRQRKLCDNILLSISVFFGAICAMICVGIIALFIIAIIIGNQMTRARHNDEWDGGYNPVPTANSVMNLYQVDTTITGRLARSQIRMVLESYSSCTTIRKVRMEWPYQARMVHLHTESDQGCISEGVVQTVANAKQTFMDSSFYGVPVAMVEARDATDHDVYVSIPAHGSTTVEIILEELLERRLGKIPFQIPLVPLATDIGRLEMQLKIQDNQSGKLKEFEIMNVHRDYLQVQWSHHEDEVTVRMDQYNSNHVPRIMKGYFDPGPLPESGLLYADTQCFEHTFNPDDSDERGVRYMPRNIVLVIDVSGSMAGQRMEDAKNAFRYMIQYVHADEYLTIQTFSNKGTESLWGPSLATDEAKSDARAFVSNLVAFGATHLSGALSDALEIARSKDANEFVPIVVVMTDGQPTVGVTDRRAIARNVWNSNTFGAIKVFGLAFGQSSDYVLMLSIALQTGGRAIRVFEGYGDSDAQMHDFFASELGEVLLSDIDITFPGLDGAPVTMMIGETQRSFAVLSKGSEITVRGMMDPTLFDDESANATSTTTLHALTSAESRTGPVSWSFEVPIRSDNGGSSDIAQNPPTRDFNAPLRCQQSFAHARISELMMYSEAAELLGTDLLEYLPALTALCGEATSSSYQAVRTCLKDAALALAVEFQLVWPGLTAMVTIENQACTDYSSVNTELCWDGEGTGEWLNRSPGFEGSGSSSGSWSSGATNVGGSSSFGWFMLIPVLVLPITHGLLVGALFVA